MESLLRTRVDRFFLEDSLKLAEIEALRDSGEIERYVMPVDEVFLNLPRLDMMPGDGDKLVHNGNPFVPELSRIGTESAAEQKTESGANAVGTACSHRLPQARVYDSAGQFIGIYGYDEDKKRYQPQKVFLGGN